MRLGGETRKAGIADKVVADGRHLFLRSVEAVDRAVIASLRDDVCPLLLDAWQDSSAPQPHIKRSRTSAFGARVDGKADYVQERARQEPEWLTWPWDDPRWPAAEEARPLVRSLRDGIRAWGTLWHLVDSWILTEALTFVVILANRRRANARLIAEATRYGSSASLTLDPEPLGFEYPRYIDVAWVPSFRLELQGWNPNWQDWPTYKKITEKAVKAALAEHRQTALLLGQEMSDGTPGKNLDASKHFRWLAEFQVLEMSYSALARRNGVSTRTVEERIPETAKLIGLRLRTS
jgi:hypothetical protein